MTKGKLMYVPKELLEELEDIQINFKVPKQSDCLRIVANNSKTARQIKLDLGFKFEKGKKHG